ncbi:MAG: Uma2 family endonuclease [Isosphaeraceae bacterium]
MPIITRPGAPQAIVYPDSDGEPIADNTRQFRWIVVIKGGLDTMLRHDPDVFVAGDLLWYPVEGQPGIRMAPDALVAFGRPKGYRGSYRQWEEGGIAPQVVFEVLSPGNRPGELGRKFEFYERYGVEEYYQYGPDRGILKGWIRSGDRLEPVANMAGFVSPRLGITFQPGEGPDSLVILQPDGRPFLTQVELVEQYEAEQRRAEEERQRAEEERQRAERYLAKLRELGIEPD